MLLCDALYSDYTKEASFIITDGEKINEGKLIVTKGETSSIEFISPDTLSGISISSDETGKADSYTLSFDGISTDIPKSLLGKISLMFTAVSDEAATGAKNLKKTDCFRVTDKDLLKRYEGYTPFLTTIRVGDVSVIVTYDSLSGEILSLCASENESSVTLDFSAHTL